MSDDLVKRLRDSCYVAFDDGTNDYNSAVEAADRIGQLEAALRELSLDWDCCAVSKAMKGIARTALEGKKDD